LPTSTESKSFIIKRPNPNPNPNSSSVFANSSNENILIYSDANSFVFENIVDRKYFYFILIFIDNYFYYLNNDNRSLSNQKENSKQKKIKY